jgi:hypothetical protein
MVVEMLDFWVVVACGLAGKCQKCFGEAYCLHSSGFSPVGVYICKSRWRYNSDDNIDTFLHVLCQVIQTDTSLKDATTVWLLRVYVNRGVP